jgi:hypothetical protein
MPRLVKYTTSGFVDNVPDQALAVIEHASLFYICEQNFKGMNKYVAFAVAGAGYEMFIANLKAGSAPEGFSAEKK